MSTENPTDKPESGPGVGSSDLFGDALRKAVMTNAEEAAVEDGECPNCKAWLRHLGNAGNTRWRQCSGCLIVWVTSPNDKLTDAGPKTL